MNIDSAKAPSPVGSYPHARRVGHLLFLSGIGPRQPDNSIPGVIYDHQNNVIDYDIEAQCHAVFKNIRLVLEEAGLSWHHLVDVTVFLTDLKRDFARYNKVYNHYFSENPPCRTTLGIDCLPTPIAIELKCTAAFDEVKS